MNKLIRLIVAIALIPAFVFMAGTACCAKPLQASVDNAKTSEVVLKAKPHSCCSGDSHCPGQSRLINKDDAIQSANGHIQKFSDVWQTNLGEFVKSVSIYFTGNSKNPTASPPNYFQAPTVQLLI